MYSITTRNLTRKYKNTVALNDFTVSIPENKIVGLVGRNGAGKTTLLRTCAGKIKQTDGDIQVFGASVFNNIDTLSKIVFVDEESAYDPTYKIKDIFALAKCYYEGWDGEFADKLIKHFTLDTKKRYGKFSKGMKTQVNLIVGICTRAPLTIFDEPTLGLDAAVRKDFYNIILNDYMKNPRTIIISSHLLNEIEILLEDIILIEKGKMVMNLPIDEFRNYCIALVGEPKFLSEVAKGKEVLAEKNLGNSVQYVIKNDLSEKEISDLEQKGICIQNVSTQDQFIYITSKGAMYDEF